MRKIETAALGIVFGAIPVIAFFLAGWWIGVPLVPKSRIPLCALAGLLFGILVDGIFLRRWIRRAYTMKVWVWMAIYGFYSIGLFGFFMGVPIFNVLLALPAGVFVGRWSALGGQESAHLRKTAQQVAVFTTSTLGLACIASAAFALASPSTGSDLQGMFGLPFPVTPMMIIGLIIGGGAAILALEWWLTVMAVERGYGFFISHPDSPIA
jgi:hypothetical protein